MQGIYDDLNKCLANLTPPPPPPPTPVSCPLACGGEGEVVATRGRELQSRLPGALGVTPRSASSRSCTVDFLDPVKLNDVDKDLMDGSYVTANIARLATDGRQVQAIAADNAASVVLRIAANEVGEKLTIAGYQQATPSNYPNLGGLYDPLSKYGPNLGTTLTLEVTAQNGPNGPVAFAVYRAPPDFVRINGAIYDCDTTDCGSNTAVMRCINFQVTTNLSATYPNYSPTGTLNIVRPPLLAVHGVWDSPSLFDSFKASLPPVLSPVFSTLSYAGSLKGQISAVDTELGGYDPPPATLPSSRLDHADTNQLGFAYNAPAVLKQARDAIKGFRISGFPGSYPTAAAQADVVAHSMGGLVTLTASYLPDYLGDGRSFGKGLIHKLVTVGTPHFGSPFAVTALWDGYRLGRLLALSGRLAFGQAVTFVDGSTTTGAAFDLQGSENGDASGLSPALLQLYQSNVLMPMHQVAGQMDTTNLSPSLLSAYNKMIFNGNESDGVVAVTSQLGRTSRPDTQMGVLHSGALLMAGFKSYGFHGHFEMDPTGPVVPRVLWLLQQPKAADSTLFAPPPN